MMNDLDRRADRIDRPFLADPRHEFVESSAIPDLRIVGEDAHDRVRGRNDLPLGVVVGSGSGSSGPGRRDARRAVRVRVRATRVRAVRRHRARKSRHLWRQRQSAALRAQAKSSRHSTKLTLAPNDSAIATVPSVDPVSTMQISSTTPRTEVRASPRKSSSLRTIMHSEIPGVDRRRRAPGGASLARGRAARHRSEPTCLSWITVCRFWSAVVMLFGVRFEGTLSEDHLGELARDRDVGLFERTGVDRTQLSVAGEPILGQARVRRGRELVAAQTRQTTLVGERRECESSRASVFWPFVKAPVIVPSWPIVILERIPGREPVLRDGVRRRPPSRERSCWRSPTRSRPDWPYPHRLASRCWHRPRCSIGLR